MLYNGYVNPVSAAFFKIAINYVDYANSLQLCEEEEKVMQDFFFLQSLRRRLPPYPITQEFPLD
jgi:hypothetical protein